jgi:hypothetical protein
VQRYQCNDCGRKFRSKRRTKKLSAVLWEQYSNGKQTLSELAKKCGKSHVWVRNKLDHHKVDVSPNITPQPTVIVADTTFWGRSYGVTVLRSWNFKRNLWWKEVSSEKMDHYQHGREVLEKQGWTITAAVIDGRRGLATVFKDVPVQVCQFHQEKTVTKYLTRKPKTEAGKELRSLALTLTQTDEETFTKQLAMWEAKHHAFYTEKTYVHGTKRWHYTHGTVRKAYLSLKRNLPYLFTYQRYPELGIPNTTNTIDGYFAGVKKKVAAHHGLRKDRRYKLICELLGRG